MGDLLTIIEGYIVFAFIVEAVCLLFVGFDRRGPAPPRGRLFWLLWVLFTGPFGLAVYLWRGRQPA
ncbi:MAG: hypothetical protein GX442_09940 [Candidatus Riflebacteria bacterium]|nr:hypothetical protein [Candidatus Riflebacteria bacterium]